MSNRTGRGWHASGKEPLFLRTMGSRVLREDEVAQGVLIESFLVSYLVVRNISLWEDT